MLDAARREREVTCEPIMNLTPVHDLPERPTPHPICLLMPSSDEDQLQSLVDDIGAHGLLDPIVLFEKRISTAATGPPRARARAESRATSSWRALGRSLDVCGLPQSQAPPPDQEFVADTLVEAKDFNLDYELGEPAARLTLKRQPRR